MRKFVFGTALLAMAASSMAMADDHHGFGDLIVNPGPTVSCPTIAAMQQVFLMRKASPAEFRRVSNKGHCIVIQANTEMKVAGFFPPNILVAQEIQSGAARFVFEGPFVDVLPEGGGVKPDDYKD